MSSTDFKNIYIIVIILTLLFGIGLGYQIHGMVSNKTSEVANNNSTSGTNTTGGKPNAQNITAIYSRTGTVTKVESGKITFQAYVLGNNAYNLTTLTATISDKTEITKTNSATPSAAPTKIATTEIKAGNEISVVSSENMYGKTTFGASSIQLHQL